MLRFPGNRRATDGALLPTSDKRRATAGTSDRRAVGGHNQTEPLHLVTVSVPLKVPTSLTDLG